MTSPVVNLLPGAIHWPAWGRWAKLALVLPSSCVAGNRLFHQHLFPEGICWDFSRCQPRQGVLFHECVLPETKPFERPFSLKVQRGREVELPLLKQKGHLKAAPSSTSFFHAEAGEFLLHSEQGAFPARRESAPMLLPFP